MKNFATHGICKTSADGTEDGYFYTDVILQTTI